jgi:hypothetical protein
MLPSDRILQHQHHARIHQNYSELIHDLIQVEKHDEFTLKNHHQHSVDTAPLPEVHYNVKGKKKNFGKFKKGKRNGKNRKNKTKGQGKGKGKAFKCHKCGGPNYFAKKCRTPQ